MQLKDDVNHYAVHRLGVHRNHIPLTYWAGCIMIPDASVMAPSFCKRSYMVCNISSYSQGHTSSMDIVQPMYWHMIRIPPSIVVYAQMTPFSSRVLCFLGSGSFGPVMHLSKREVCRAIFPKNWKNLNHQLYPATSVLSSPCLCK